MADQGMSEPGFNLTSQAPYRPSDEEMAAIKAAIDADELVALALELGNIPSPSRHEAAASDFVYRWMEGEGFRPRQVGVTPDRQNVIGEYGGRGRGKNLLYTAHLDTESPTWDPDLDVYRYRPETLADPEWQQCWLEDGKLFGFPISNDRGPMSCFLIAAKALRKAGIELAGKLYLTACPGEIGPDPVEEWRGYEYLGKDIGAHYLFHHGGVAPDFAIAAEGTDFGLTWQGCGTAVYRIRLLGQGVFTPILTHPEKAEDHPNPIYRLGPVIEALHRWGREYEVRHAYETEGGHSIPKVQIDSVRAGNPLSFGAGTEVCSLYLEVALTPQMKAADVEHELIELLSGTPVESFEVEPVVVRHGFEAKPDEVMPLVAAVDDATRNVLGVPVKRAAAPYSSMWRDQNVFNMHRIPAVTTGMPRWRPTPADLAHSAMIYAATALAICGRAETGSTKSSGASVYGSENPFGN